MLSRGGAPGLLANHVAAHVKMGSNSIVNCHLSMIPAVAIRSTVFCSNLGLPIKSLCVCGAGHGPGAAADPGKLRQSPPRRLRQRPAADEGAHMAALHQLAASTAPTACAANNTCIAVYLFPYTDPLPLIQPTECCAAAGGPGGRCSVSGRQSDAAGAPAFPPLSAAIQSKLPAARIFLAAQTEPKMKRQTEHCSTIP